MGNHIGTPRKVLLIATGGTIACRETENGLAPVLDGESLLRELPELASVCDTEVLDLMQRDSTDVTAADRMQMARAVWEKRGAYDGFVIAHGTDTLACTAALLHHLLPGIDRSVVVTGSMLPMGADGSDAPGNLADALRVAADGRRGVYAVLRGKILRGTNVLKVHSTALDAFVSVNEPPAGRIENGKVLWDAPEPAEATPRLVTEIDPHVFVLRLTPDLPPSFFSVLSGFSNVIIETFGGGGIPARMEQAVHSLIESGTRVLLTTQCIEGGVHLHKYEVGRRAEAMGAVSLGMRTVEDALAAVMCGEM